MLSPFLPRITSIVCKNPYSTSFNFTALQQFLNSTTNLKELRFNGSSLSTPFPINFKLPKTIQILEITTSCSLSLPQSLRELKISIQWPLNNTIIPSLINLNLTSLSITGLGLDVYNLPATLQTLTLCGTFKSLNHAFFNLPILSSLTIQESGSGLSTSAVLPDDARIIYLPPSLTCLRLPHNSMSSLLLQYPHNLKSLCIDYGSEWRSVQFYQSMQVPDTCNIKREYPQSVKELEIHLLSLPRLQNVPPNLTHLHIHVNDFNQPLNNLPASLRFLTLNTRPRCFRPPKFDHPLDKLPLNLVC